MDSWAIDWVAAGSWAQAVASLLGAAAVAYAARTGADTFGQWRQQKLAERRMAVADQILGLAYQAELAFPVIRSPMMWAGELQAAEKTLREASADYEAVATERQQRMRTAQVFFDRLNQYQELWAGLIAVLPTAKAYFGADIADRVRDLLRHRHAISTSAEFYIDNDESVRTQVMGDLFGGREKDDPVTVGVAQALATLEATLLPEIRSDVADLQGRARGWRVTAGGRRTPDRPGSNKP